MSLKRVGELVDKELNSVMCETREYRSFALGLAYGYYFFYKTFSEEHGVETAKKCFSAMLEDKYPCDQYFRQLVEADEESDTRADEIYEKYKRLRKQHIDDKQ